MFLAQEGRGTLSESSTSLRIWASGSRYFRQYHSEPIRNENEIYFGPKFSPDGQNIAFWMKIDDKSQVWIYNPERDQLSRFTSVGENFWPIWSPDGNAIVFPSIRAGSLNVNAYSKSYYLTEPAIPLIKSKKAIQPKLWSSDGRFLLYHQFDEESGSSIFLFDIMEGKSIPFLNESYDEGKPDFSPNNKWLVYESNETGSFEVYVTSFPGKSFKHQISSYGGNEPLWSSDGDKIYYRNDDGFYVVNVLWEGNEVSFKKPIKMFSGPFRYTHGWGRNYDLSPDGKKFITILENDNINSLKTTGVISNFLEVVSQRKVEQ